MHPVSRNMARLMRRIRRRDMKIGKLKRELRKLRRRQRKMEKNQNIMATKKERNIGGYEKRARALTPQQKTSYNQLWDEPLEVWQEKARQEGAYSLCCHLILAPRFKADMVGTLVAAIERMESYQVPGLLFALTRYLEVSERVSVLPE